MGHIEFVDCDRLVCWSGDFGSGRYGHDHSNVGFSERIGFCDGESGRFIRNALADELEFRFAG